VGEIRLRRAYEPAAAGDGYRVLVDRIWPRGVTKAELAIDSWRKDLAPSTALRRWFGHDPARWDEFKARYRQEIEASGADLSDLLSHCRTGTLTLVFGAKDERHNNAVVLKDHLSRLDGERS
jgi:uncharacterized protein YeaO (DUF488 family)